MHAHLFTYVNVHASVKNAWLRATRWPTLSQSHRGISDSRSCDELGIVTGTFVAVGDSAVHPLDFATHSRISNQVLLDFLVVLVAAVWG